VKQTVPAGSQFVSTMVLHRQLAVVTQITIRQLVCFCCGAVQTAVVTDHHAVNLF
jgi:hypothetical protein